MHKTKTSIFYSVLAVLFIGMLFLFSLRNRTLTIDSGYRMTMGTFARILVTAQNQEQANTAIKAAFDKIYQIQELMSDYDPNSMLSKVNRDAFKSPVPVNDELFEVLTVSKSYSCLSNGAFDVTVGPVVQLWRKAKQDGKAPSAEALQKAKQCVGYESLILDPEKQTVQFDKEGMSLDLGGIAKGYAIDKAIEILRASGIKGAMVDIGGDLRCFGTPANSARHWFIGLQDPAHEGSILLKLNLDDMAVATSGDYQRFVMIEDKKHSHIINPVTADSAGELSSVTVIAPTAMASDALATTVSVLGNKKGLELISTIQNTEAILITQDDQTPFEKSAGFGRYILDNKQPPRAE